ncbi:hypothetical protein PVPAM_030027700 [Plasmodium vivax]|nr:hypothetical protein PVPAM_030027700 [Plasmodium vivax]
MVVKRQEKPKHPIEFLPSRRRTNDIIRGIEFMDIMDHINDENVANVEKWLNNFNTNLKTYLNGIRAKKEKIDTNVHCRDLNYIIDTILERISKLTRIDRVKWDHDIQKISNNLLNYEFMNLNCARNMYNSNNDYMHIKKYIHDLCEDIGHILKKKNWLRKRKVLCNNVISRVLERQKQLLDVFHTNTSHSVFNFDKNCTIDYIMNNFSGNECNIVPERARAMEQTRSILKKPSEEDSRPALLTVPGPDLDKGPDKALEEASEQEDGEFDLSGPEVKDFRMNMPLQLPPGEEPKLDTTYAAASLCGVSLIGAMIYKFKPFGFGSRAPRMRNGMGGYPLPHAANGDYVMGNFEYLQTGTPNHDYHLGYGPAADN